MGKEIHAEQQQLTAVKDGAESTQPYSQLVLAVGANPIRLAIAGDGSNDIQVVNNLDDYKAFRAELEKRADKRVVILGAGLIGCEFANDLQHTGHQATVIDLANQPLGRLLPAHVSSAFKENLEATGIHFCPWAQQLKKCLKLKMVICCDLGQWSVFGCRCSLICNWLTTEHFPGKRSRYSNQSWHFDQCTT